ncbi:putative replication factor C subunit 3 [Leptomonas pyrrhocoris]|uniref:Putative replication factor C subunit 3 n=1 Tax=Leptomonas pyrrhocoris TaxID=157538 RepID=A0A0M9GAQ2_LEPPY|nr:putative replication factor C subunit 3 [Leptomonas pyrrhocoris]XP_015664807.1 putative replication factor C subunit 3 [Leptomonas pyrrhocoris]KPA86367.1 putative replication factor C subunit 3 [Leptomonas pyrrhocoris]KPA86368.1 putative replication factor C subunit 3 [Leptomonas pyrrhocoris]|eukprot:XP_015664806.1 putative replication factor C subunit 3 [Leptomonas pyrrhocoris]
MMAISKQAEEGKSGSNHLPWVEKYRPSTLDSVVAHEDILNTLRHLMNSGNMPHLLLYGPPGTGKTTTIKACAHYLYGKDRVRANVLEMNASDDRGIDVVRQQIREFSSTSSIFSMMGPSSSNGNGSSTGGPIVNFKLVILDEADQMSHDAQAALRRVIEKYTKNVRFCILCNHINKVIPALQSRCTRFRFAPVKKSAMMPRLKYVAEQEDVRYTTEGLAAAFRLSHGDLRRCLNTMQSSALSASEITEESVYRVTGNPTPGEVTAIVADMLSGDFATSWAKVEAAVMQKGISMADLARDIHPIMMAMDLPQDCKCFLVMKLSDIEYYAAGGARESTGLGGLLGAFQLVKEAVTQRKPIKEVAGDCVS